MGHVVSWGISSCGMSSWGMLSDHPINKSTRFLWHTLLPVPALQVCRSTNQQLFSGIHVRKSNCQLCRPANQQINTFPLTYTIANTSSACLPINKSYSAALSINVSTHFFWYTCSKIFIVMFYEYYLWWSANQHFNIFFLAYIYVFFRTTLCIVCTPPPTQTFQALLDELESWNLAAQTLTRPIWLR